MKKLVFLLLLSTSACVVFAQTAPPKTAVKDSVILADYVGVFKFSETFGQATITLKDGFIFGEVDSYGNNKLLPEADVDTFKSTSSYGTIYVFKRNPEKKVITLTLKVMGQEVTGVK
jgi:hypothetical protein